MPLQTFQTKMEEMNQKIKDITNNNYVQTREIKNLREEISKQEKRIIWCEENLKVNLSPKGKDGDHTTTDKARDRE